MSAPPDSRPLNDMNSQQPEHPPHAEQSSNVRHIPIFVEGRDEPVINKAECGKQQTYAPPPQQTYAPPPQPHIDRDQYFADDGPAAFHHAPNFSRAFGTPFNKGFRPGPQPFTQQKAYPQNAFARGASPQRSQSPKQHEEHFVKVPVHHDHTQNDAPARAQPPPKQNPPQQPPQREPTPPQAPPKPSPNDPITQILSIQTDVLNLMSEVENFTGAKKDKRYIFLDEMLTRNLIKLDNIETEGKENIRLARKEAIRCIQKCIAVLEAKAEKGSSAAQAQDVEMSNDEAAAPANNGEVEIKEEKTEPQAEQVETQKKEEGQPQAEAQPQDKPKDPEAAEPADALPQETVPSEHKAEEQNDQVEDKPSPKKKIVKKRDKSKDKAPADSAEAAKDSNKVEENVEVMQLDNKGDKTEQVMEVDGAASQ